MPRRTKFEPLPENQQFKMVRLGSDVWNHIAAHGVYGESVDEVLLRLLNLTPDTQPKVRAEPAPAYGEVAYR